MIYNRLFLLAILLFWIVAWTINFPYYFGWQVDDWFGYQKALATTENWTNAFLVRANLLQPYFLTYSYIPVALGLELPSFLTVNGGPFTAADGPFTDNARFLGVLKGVEK